jgi:hypothetical protein
MVRNGRCWFGELLDGFFDSVEDRFTGVDDSRKHEMKSPFWPVAMEWTS